MDWRNFGFIDNALVSTLHDMMDLSDDVPGSGVGAAEKNLNAPSRTFVRDANAMARTPADVKEYPNAYQFTVDMPGVRPSEVKVQLDENDGVLMVSGERRREEKSKEGEDSGVKYLRMERRMGKFMRKFALPEDANREAITAVCCDGVLTVTIDKLPPPEPKKPKTIEVKVA